MKHAKTIALGCAIALLAMAGTASAQNLITNGDFETGDLTGWVLAGQTADSDVVIDPADNGPTGPGTNCAFMDNHAQAIGLLLKQSTAAGSASAGDVNYSFDLKLGEQANSGVFFVEIFAEQAGGGVIGGSGVLGSFAPVDWTPIAGTFSAPAGTDFLTIQFVATTGAVAGAASTMSVDNVNLDQGSVPTESNTLSGIKALY